MNEGWKRKEKRRKKIRFTENCVRISNLKFFIQKISDAINFLSSPPPLINLKRPKPFKFSKGIPAICNPFSSVENLIGYISFAYLAKRTLAFFLNKKKNSRPFFFKSLILLILHLKFYFLKTDDALSLSTFSDEKLFWRSSQKKFKYIKTKVKCKMWGLLHPLLPQQ